MSKASLEAIGKSVGPYQKKLEAFLEKGGTVTEFAIAYPAEALLLAGAVNAAISIVCTDDRIRL